MYSPDRIKRLSLDERGGGCWVWWKVGSGAAADRVVNRRLATALFTFEYFASLDNYRAQKDSSTADTYIYYTYYIIYFVRNVNFTANPTAAAARRGIASSLRESSWTPQQKDAVTIWTAGYLGIQSRCTSLRWKGSSDFIIYIYHQTAQFAFPNVYMCTLYR